jgi:hypothetical protein
MLLAPAAETSKVAKNNADDNNEIPSKETYILLYEEKIEAVSLFFL